MRRFTVPISAALVLAGCASGARAPSTTTIARPSPVSPVVPRPQPGSGDLVIGRTANALIALFGQPALDVPEGNARKLQFSGETCVLDAYLYPPQGRGEPVASHVDARLPDGSDADRAACAASLRRR